MKVKEGRRSGGGSRNSLKRQVQAPPTLKTSSNKGKGHTVVSKPPPAEAPPPYLRSSSYQSGPSGTIPPATNLLSSPSPANPPHITSQERRNTSVLLPSPPTLDISSQASALLTSRLKDRELELEGLRARLAKSEAQLEKVQLDNKVDMQEFAKQHMHQLTNLYNIHHQRLDELNAKHEMALKSEIAGMVASTSSALNEVIEIAKSVGKDVGQVWRHIKHKTLDWRHMEKMQHFLGAVKGGTKRRYRRELSSSRSESTQDSGTEIEKSLKKKRRKHRGGSPLSEGWGSGSSSDEKQRKRTAGGGSSSK